MKARKAIAAAAALVLTVCTALGIEARNPQPRLSSGPGIVMSGSQNYSALPKAAKAFVEKHFKGVGVTKCEQFFAKGKYEVELANGIDLEFDNAGKVIEIDAPDNMCLAPAVVKDVIHGNAYRRLEKDGLASNVESVEFDKRGRVVEVEVSISGPDVYVFDLNGNFIAIED